MPIAMQALPCDGLSTALSERQILSRGQTEFYSQKQSGRIFWSGIPYGHTRFDAFGYATYLATGFPSLRHVEPSCGDRTPGHRTPSWIST